MYQWQNLQEGLKPILLRCRETVLSWYNEALEICLRQVHLKTESDVIFIEVGSVSECRMLSELPELDASETKIWKTVFSELNFQSLSKTCTSIKILLFLC